MSAVLGDWSWVAGEQALSLEMRPGRFTEALSGHWTLTDFGHILDGLSLRRLVDALSGDEPSVTCGLQLADGRAVHLAGTFTRPGEARGLVLEAGTADAESRDPQSQLRAAYQPIYNLVTGRIDGFEALARWDGEDRRDRAQGPRTDDRALASNMLLQASEALARWQAETGRPDLFVQVNLTGRDLDDATLADLVAALVGGFSLPPGSLRLELTEQAALRNARQAQDMAVRLQAAGAALVLDDFGSGHSSFLWLADFPAGGLKVDASLIARLQTPRVRIILESVTQLAHRLDMTVTAEGVETTALLPELRQSGFDFAQGFALGRPLSRDQTSQLLQAPAPALPG